VETTRSGAARYGRVVLLTVAAFAVAGGAAYWAMSRGGEQSRTARPSTRPAVPVSVATVAKRDLPLYLTGLGTVQASFTVRVNPQVDGRLQEVLFAEGQRVKKGDVLARIDPRLYRAALDQAKAKKAQDEALLVAAEKDLVRAETLVGRSFGTEQNVDQQRAKVAQLKASIAADEAAIETAQTQLDYTTITAQNDGRVGMRLVDPGNLIRVADANPIATLILLQPSAVVFTVPSRVLPDVREAMARGPVEVIAFDQGNRRTLATGTLLLIDNAIDQATSTGRLKAMFPNEDENLWPGDFVNARVLLKTQANALAMPSTAVQRGPQGLFAWIVTDKNTAEPRPIEVGSTSGDMTIVTAGLKEGERVVTDGQYKLFRNAVVTVGTPKSAEAGLAK
jgi:multidrug efflux system membrane fusion protein